jgi:hypothetical protein
MNEQELKKLYCELVNDDIDFEELRKEKTAFMEAHFSVAPIELFHAGFAVPALCLCLIGAFFMMPFSQKVDKIGAPVHLSEMNSEKSSPVEQSVLEETITYKEALEEQLQEPQFFESQRHVEVMRLTSEVGSTMFYQKTLNDRNVTVVWVFPAGIA